MRPAAAAAVAHPHAGPRGAVAPHPPIAGYYERDEDKRKFLRQIFDETAGDYEKCEKILAFGTGYWYRRRALARAGLRRGMRVVDVAAGTGLVTKAAVGLTGGPRRVLGLDPSAGMLAEAVRSLRIPAVMATAEQMPLADGSFDFLSMGYALRHVTDLTAAFREFLRVLKPGGTACLLEITPPRSWLGRAALKLYVKEIAPRIYRLTARNARTEVLWRYHWETIEACVPPERVMEAMRAAGFEDVRRHLVIGIFSEYTGRKPE